MKKRTILVVLGTRPEAIKLAPVIIELRKHKDYNVLVCNTEQQKELSNQTLAFFDIKADFNLDAMRPDQTLPEVQSRIMEALSAVYKTNPVDATIVQGDTMTVLCGALVSFYNKVPVFHIEAGLRSCNLFEPYPEEAIRQMAARLCDLHFAPTPKAQAALLKENIAPEKIILTGNTVIDALSCLSEDTIAVARHHLQKTGIMLNDKLVLVTVHRRENHGKRLDNILSAIFELTQEFADHQFILPVHPNPNVQTKVYTALQDVPNIILTQPLDYPQLVCLMKEAKLIMTDSGGIQEEAPTFGVPVLVMRYETERQEGVEAGFAKLVGADPDKIISKARSVLQRDKISSRLNGRKNPYGNGQAAKNIYTAIINFFSENVHA